MTIAETLEAAGYPDTTLVLDFESYYDTEYTLSKMSSVEYIADPRFEFTGLGVKVGTDDSEFVPDVWVPQAIFKLHKKYGPTLEGVTVIVKNSKFDILILTEKFGIYPEYVIDIEDLSRYYDSRMKQKLGDLCKLFKLEDKGDTSQFKGQHQKDIDQEIMRAYCLGDVDREYELLEILLPMIDNLEIELQLMQHTLNLYLKPPFKLDVDLAKNISAGMQKELRRDLLEVRWVLEYANKKKKTISDILRARSILPVILDGVLPEGEGVPMKMGKKKMIPALAQEDEPFQLLLVHPAKKVRGLMRAKAAVTSWPLHRAKVESIVRQAVYSNGMMRVPIKYYGAHTGRWSGTAGVNLLNLGGKGNRKTGKQHHPLIGKVRNALLAPKGKTLVIADSCQIEARELAWIAGQNDLVESYRAGGDPYSELATEIFGEPVWKPTKEELLTPEGVILDIRRGWGKDTELGAGFGLGPNTMFLNCRKNKTLRPLFDSGEYDWNFIDNIIKTYRKKRYMIPKFWKTIEKSFRWVTKYHNEVAEYYIPGGEITFQGIAVKYNAMLEPTLRFWRDGSDTIIQLPSGRRLFYRHAVVTRKKELKYIWGPLYGGMLTENIIQAICRDLLAGWLLECERVRIPIILHTYDELVGCVPIDRAVEVLEQMIRIMNTGPDWTAGLPLDTEGGISPCFKK